MDVRVFGNFLLALAVGLLVCGLGVLANHKMFPKGESAEARVLLFTVYGEKSYSDKLEARQKLDEMYESDKTTPPSVNYLLIVAVATFALGIGLRIATGSSSARPADDETLLHANNEAGVEGDVPSSLSTPVATDTPNQSIADQLAALSKLKDSGHLSDEQFEIAKSRVLVNANGQT